MSTQYTCPKCNGVNTDPEVLEGLVRCTGCGEWFAAEAAQMISEPTVETSVQLATLDESTQLAATADFFVWAAIIFVIIGIIGLLIVLGYLGEKEQPAWPGYLCVGSFGAAFWFYLIGQIIHIRALLAKK